MGVPGLAGGRGRLGDGLGGGGRQVVAGGEDGVGLAAELFCGLLEFLLGGDGLFHHGEAQALGVGLGLGGGGHRRVLPAVEQAQCLDGGRGLLGQVDGGGHRGLVGDAGDAALGLIQIGDAQVLLGVVHRGEEHLDLRALGGLYRRLGRGGGDGHDHVHAVLHKALADLLQLRAVALGVLVVDLHLGGVVAPLLQAAHKGLPGGVQGGVVQVLHQADLVGLGRSLGDLGGGALRLGGGGCLLGGAAGKHGSQQAQGQPGRQQLFHGRTTFLWGVKGKPLRLPP